MFLFSNEKEGWIGGRVAYIRYMSIISWKFQILLSPFRDLQQYKATQGRCKQSGDQGNPFSSAQIKLRHSRVDEFYSPNSVTKPTLTNRNLPRASETAAECMLGATGRRGDL